tara:strand:+ start:15290 stop:16075 length:786 start_codon:yes stop_codon:yes gene_type:complete
LTSGNQGDPRNQFPSPDAEILHLEAAEANLFLETGEFLGGHTMPWGSNYTFLVWLSADSPDKCIQAIYKPRDGEKPLHDFPHGTLYKREFATYLLSKELGWPNVPLTTIREGPYGVGSMQLYVDCDPRITYFEIRDTMPDELEKLAVFDLLTNNADRKAGHCLLDNHETIWSIDHGLTFHSVFKLRTVMLEYCGKRISESLIDDLKLLAGRMESSSEIKSRLETQTSAEEIESLKTRLDVMITDPVIPILDPYRDVPWPFV